MVSIKIDKIKRKTKKEFSKTWVTIILSISILLLITLVILDRMESLAIAIVTEIIAVFGGYMIKAYLGKYNEEKNKLNQSNEEDDER